MKDRTRKVKRQCFSRPTHWQRGKDPGKADPSHSLSKKLTKLSVAPGVVVVVWMRQLLFPLRQYMHLSPLDLHVQCFSSRSWEGVGLAGYFLQMPYEPTLNNFGQPKMLVKEWFTLPTPWVNTGTQNAKNESTQNFRAFRCLQSHYILLLFQGSVFPPTSLPSCTDQTVWNTISLASVLADSAPGMVKSPINAQNDCCQVITNFVNLFGEKRVIWHDSCLNKLFFGILPFFNGTARWQDVEEKQDQVKNPSGAFDWS